MASDRQDADHGRFGRGDPSEDERIQVVQHETAEDWQLLSALLGGLALALLANTFIGSRQHLHRPDPGLAGNAISEAST